MEALNNSSILKIKLQRWLQMCWSNILDMAAVAFLLAVIVTISVILGLLQVVFAVWVFSQVTGLSSSKVWSDLWFLLMFDV